MWLKKESLFFFLITDFISVKDIKWGGGARRFLRIRASRVLELVLILGLFVNFWPPIVP